MISETDRALRDHELIKVRINAADRDERIALGERLREACGAEGVQRIGKMLVLYRPNPEARPELSNIARAQRSSATAHR